MAGGARRDAPVATGGTDERWAREKGAVVVRCENISISIYEDNPTVTVSDRRARIMQVNNANWVTIHSRSQIRVRNTLHRACCRHCLLPNCWVSLRCRSPSTHTLDADPCLVPRPLQSRKPFETDCRLRRMTGVSTLVGLPL
jgi:hypothetical protein